MKLDHSRRFLPRAFGDAGLSLIWRYKGKVNSEANHNLIVVSWLYR